MDYHFFINFFQGAGVITNVFLASILVVWIYAALIMWWQTSKLIKGLESLLFIFQGKRTRYLTEKVEYFCNTLINDKTHVFHYLAKSMSALFVYWRNSHEKVSVQPQFYELLSMDKLLERHIDEARFANLRSLMVSLGVIGTFLGLVLGIEGASGGLASTDSAIARLSLEELLSGAGTAFYTSLAGISASTVFGILYQWKLNSVSKEQNHLIKGFMSELPLNNDNGNKARTANDLEKLLELSEQNFDESERQQVMIIQLLEELKTIQQNNRWYASNLNKLVEKKLEEQTPF